MVFQFILDLQFDEGYLICLISVPNRRWLSIHLVGLEETPSFFVTRCFHWWVLYRSVRKRSLEIGPRAGKSHKWAVLWIRPYSCNQSCSVSIVSRDKTSLPTAALFDSHEFFFLDQDDDVLSTISSFGSGRLASDCF